MSQEEVQLFLGYDGLVQADRRRKALLDQKIKLLEIELSRLRKHRRQLKS